MILVQVIYFKVLAYDFTCRLTHSVGLAGLDELWLRRTCMDPPPLKLMRASGHGLAIGLAGRPLLIP
jgi:hypothetical protein